MLCSGRLFRFALKSSQVGAKEEIINVWPHTAVEATFYCWGVQAATRFSLILLLFGTIVGDFALLADVGTRAVERLHAAHAAPPAWLVGYHGRVIMTLLAVFLVYPLCCLRRSGSHP